MSRTQRNILVAGFFTLFAGGMGVIPLYFSSRFKSQNINLTTTDNPLAGQAVVRGAFVNSGSKDVGPDPDWDPVTRTWRGRSSQKKIRESQDIS